METVGEKLQKLCNDKTDLEIVELSVRFARFNCMLKEIYDSSIKSIENNINESIAYYGKSAEQYLEEKNKILDKYTEEFQKIYDERKNQFLNFESSIAEIEANRQIAIANFFKITEDRREYMKQPQYVEYITKKQSYENIIEGSMVKSEYDKYTKLLENLSDPAESYEVKMVALLRKYNDYTELKNECYNKLDDCLTAARTDFEEITKYRNEGLIPIKNKNFISTIISKISNLFSGSKKFEKEVIQKMNSELQEVEKSNEIAIDEINNQTVSILELIDKVRNEINSQFNLAINQNVV